MTETDIFGGGNVVVVIGGQYGSEGKGEFVGWATRHYSVKSVIRTGGPNAGHTVTVPEELSQQTFKMRQVPCGWVESKCPQLVVGPGSLLNQEVLADELSMLRKTILGRDIMSRLFIDERATILEHHHEEMEKASDLKERLGSTREGIGAARADRIWRLARIAKELHSTGLQIVPRGWITTEVDRILEQNSNVIVESTQGYELSLAMSGNYPFVTSADITPGHIMGEAGLSSRLPHKVVVVLRSYPIRVAGNSGDINTEATWSQLHDENPAIPAEGERTTVTNLIRRVGHFDWDRVREMCRQIKPDAICLTFADYINEANVDAAKIEDLTPDTLDFIHHLEETTNTPVLWVTNGPGKVLR